MKKILIVCTILSVVRLIMVLGFQYEIPNIKHKNNFHQGGDQKEYFRNSKSISNRILYPSKLPIGYPLLLTLPVLIIQPDNWEELINPVIALHAFLHTIIIFLLAWLVWIKTKSTRTVIIISTLWTLLPYILYGLAFFDSDNTEAIQQSYISHLMGFPMYSESLAALTVLFGICLFYYKKTDMFTALAGAVIGYCILVRTQNIILPCILTGILFYKRQFKRLLIFSIAVFILILPQILIHLTCFGNITGYTASTEHHALFSFENFWAGIKFSIPVIVPILAAFLLNRKNELAIITLTYTLFISSWWAFKDFPLRFLIPILPVYLTAVLTAFTGRSVRLK